MNRTYVHDPKVLRAIIKDDSRPPYVGVRLSVYQSLIYQLGLASSDGPYYKLQPETKAGSGVLAVAELVRWVDHLYLIGFEGHTDTSNALTGKLPEYSKSAPDHEFLEWDKKIRRSLAASAVDITLLGKVGALAAELPNGQHIPCSRIHVAEGLLDAKD